MAAKKSTAKSAEPDAAEPKAAPEAPAQRDLGQAERQALADEATEKGYIGREVDDTPNGNYTLAGVTAGKPTPETKKRS